MAEDNNSDRTALLGFDQETINRELQKAKEQPACLILIRGTKESAFINSIIVLLKVAVVLVFYYQF